MRRENLTQYVFVDGSETITTRRGKVVAVKDPHTDYLPLRMLFQPHVQGSTPRKYSNEFSSPPRLHEHLLTAKLLGFGRCISSSRIIEIHEGISLLIGDN